MENKKINNGKIYSLIKYEYLRWLINPRIAIFACMLIFIVNYMVDVMVNASNTMGEPLGVFELFIATANSEEMCIIMPAVFFILIGDFPRKDPNALLYVHRLGRLKWLVGQAPGLQSNRTETSGGCGYRLTAGVSDREPFRSANAEFRL